MRIVGRGITEDKQAESYTRDYESRLPLEFCTDGRMAAASVCASAPEVANMAGQSARLGTVTKCESVQPTMEGAFERLSDGLQQRLLGLRASCRTLSSHENWRRPLEMLNQ